MNNMKMLRVNFLFMLFCLLGCNSSAPEKKVTADVHSNQIVESATQFKYSLGQWSFHKDLFDGKMTTIDFINITKELGFDGVDFVNQFFTDKADDVQYLNELKTALNKNKLEAAMIMVDREGDLGNPDKELRNQALSNHKKWVRAAKQLDCKVVRVNAFGDGKPQQVMDACESSIGALAEYAKKYGVLILIENHGGYSSDGDWLLGLMKRLEGKNVALLPDFDNWCIERENNERWGAPCIKEYDRYLGIKQLLPYAKSLSIKSFGFTEEGNEIKTDYNKMFKLIAEAGYTDYLGIEYEGETLTPIEGIKKTLTLVKSISKGK